MDDKAYRCVLVECVQTLAVILLVSTGNVNVHVRQFLIKRCRSLPQNLEGKILDYSPFGWDMVIII